MPFLQGCRCEMSTWYRCLMQGCKCKVYSWWRQCTHSNHDANVSLQRRRCKCLLMGMSWCKCPFVGMPWCKCFDANNLFKNSLCFRNQGFLSAKNILICYFPKSHLLLFYLRLPKKWWSLLEDFWMGIDSESDDLAQKIYFHDLVEQKDGMFPRPFFGEMNSLKIKHLKKIHFF